jgi:glycosyltransferase involved in cell wall biosynthesis
MRIVHVTESCASGVLTVVSQLVQAQTQAGAEVWVIHSRRPDTPDDSKLDRILAGAVRRFLPMQGALSPVGCLTAVGRLTSLLRDIRPDVIHLHSSVAGAVGRIAARWIKHPAVLYTPHGLAFLRLDIPRWQRSVFKIAEVVLGRLTGEVLCCSESEASMLRPYLGSRCAVVENAADDRHVIPRKPRGDTRIEVVTCGRVCFQKAPWRFERLAREVGNGIATFTWIGAPVDEQAAARFALDPGVVATTGWLDRPAMMNRIAGADIFVLLSLWEGMPLSLIEAQMAGLPAVVSDTIGSRDVVRDGVTGFICRDDTEVLARVRELISDPSRRAAMGAAARALSVGRFSVSRLHDETWSLYLRALTRAPGAHSPSAPTVRTTIGK